MASSGSFERTIEQITSLTKSEVKKRLLNFKGRFKLDFTEKYLDSLGVDRLRHILLAAVLARTGKH